MPGSSARVSRRGARQLTAITVAGGKLAATPALLNSTSMEPLSSSATRSISAGSDKSTLTSRSAGIGSTGS